MYTVAIIVDNATSAGKPIPKGTIISHNESWRLCLPGYRNSPPKAEPVDDVTRTKVAAATRKREARLAAVSPTLQAAINKLAAKLPTDEAGQFIRTSNGGIKGAKEAEAALIDNAEAYGIRPTPKEL